MHEEALHLPQAEPAALTQLRRPTDGQCKGAVDNLGSLERQSIDRQALSQPRQTLWRKRRGQGQSVYARDKEN